MPRPLLTARWANLAIISYAVPPAMLAPYIPAAPDGDTLELDTRDDLVPNSSKPYAFLSLVALEFHSTRILGLPVPGHSFFPQINLRFYVRTAGSRQRGVVFIREIVPRPLMAWAARRFMNEPYLAAPLTSRITQDASSITAEYQLTLPAGVRNTLRVRGRKPVARPGPDSVEHWFKERPLGFGMTPPRGGRPGRGTVLEVIHPSWGVYPVTDHHLAFDFAAVYGPDWGFLSAIPPAHITLAVGSEVALFPPKTTVGIRWGVKREPRGAPTTRR